MAVFEEVPLIDSLKLPPRDDFDSKQFEVAGEYSAVTRADCEQFLLYLREYGIASYAARELGRSEVCFQVLRSQNRDFAAAWDWAEREASDKLELEARKRAMQGVERAVWYKGDEVGTETIYSDTLLATLLKHKHRDFKQVEEESDRRDAPVQSIVINAIPSGTHYDRPDGNGE